MAGPIYLLDTSILLALIRGGDLGKFVDATYGLRSRFAYSLICIVSHGEIWSLAAQNSWGAAKRSALDNMLSNLVTVDINSREVIDAYVEMDVASRGHPGGARQLSKNDLWIAAAAKAASATLLTTDQDFNHLHPAHLQRIYVDPNSKP